MEEDVKNLKHEISELKKDAKIKENKLASWTVKEIEFAKLIYEITGKAVEGANLNKIWKI